jgi:pyruvate dehydrogenase E2 component (dihydrolipoamide acetyltransferase)
VEVGTIVAIIETEKGAARRSRPPRPAHRRRKESEAAPKCGGPRRRSRRPAEPPPAAASRRHAGACRRAGDESAEDRLRRKSTPLVRRIAAEHDVDIADIEGTGHAGRVTKQDIMSFIEKGGKPAAKPAGPGRARSAGSRRQRRRAARRSRPTRSGRRSTGRCASGVPGPRERRRRADGPHPPPHRRPHGARQAHRAARALVHRDRLHADRPRARREEAKWQQAGVKVSYTGFVAWAVARVLPEFPMVNSTVSGDNIIYRGDINVGIAVDLNPGLIVPVIKNADELNLVGISKRINDLAERARGKKLKPDEIQGATFSITNPGVLGTMVGMPVIPEGTAAILGTGAIEKRPVVIEADGTDVIAIRKRSLFSLGYDHRIVDGADAARFLWRLKETLEDFPEDA